MVFNQVFIQMYFTPEDFFYVFIRLLSQVFIRDAPGISEKDENRSKSTKVTKVIKDYISTYNKESKIDVSIIQFILNLWCLSLTPPFFSCLPSLLLLFFVPSCFGTLAAFVVVKTSDVTYHLTLK